MSDSPDIRKLRHGAGGWIGPEELHEVLANEGYSADQRDQFLKSALTRLTKAESDPSDARQTREALMREVRDILSQEQEKEGRKPMSDDV